MPESISPLLNIVVRCLVLALVFAAAWWHIGVLLPFALSLVLAYLLHPSVDRLVLWRLPRWFAVSMCLLLTFFTVAVVLLLLVPIVFDLVPMIRSQLPDLMMRGWHALAPILLDLGVPVPKSADQWRGHLAELLETHGGEWGATLWRSVVQGGVGLFAVFGYAVLVPMLAFYWLMDWARVMGAARTLAPMRWRSGLDGLIGELDSLMGQYLRGQALVMLVLAVFYSVGLGLFGFHLALPIGVFTGLAVCIPYLGFGLGLILACVSGLLQFAASGDSLLLPLIGVVVVYGLGQLIESAFLTPRLVGERIGLHPLGVILSLMLFGQWLGFWGIVIALPCAACLTVIGRRLLVWWQNSPDFLRLD